MKINKRKSIDILGSKFKIEWDKEYGGGNFSFLDLKIRIGIKYIKSDFPHTWNVLVHELSEACHVVLNIRYSDPSCDSNYKFFMDHKEFENHNKLLSSILLKFIK